MATASRARTCERTGCGRPYRARGLCSTHYNQDHQPDRHTKVEVPCAWCGVSCMKEPTRANRYAQVFCSLECRDQQRKQRESSRWYRAQRKVARAAAGTRGSVWTAGPCMACGQPFVSWVGARHCSPECTRRRPIRPRWVAGRCRQCGAAYVGTWLAEASAIYCSLACGKRAARRRRRARTWGVHRQHYRPTDVYARDGWRCHLCHRAVRRRAVVPHPLAPTIDHLVPLSCGGHDEPANVACAHYSCNTKRGVKGEVQLLLFGDAE